MGISIVYAEYALNLYQMYTKYALIGARDNTNLTSVENKGNLFQINVKFKLWLLIIMQLRLRAHL